MFYCPFQDTVAIRAPSCELIEFLSARADWFCTTEKTSSTTTILFGSPVRSFQSWVPSPGLRNPRGSHVLHLRLRTRSIVPCARTVETSARGVRPRPHRQAPRDEYQEGQGQGVSAGELAALLSLVIRNIGELEGADLISRRTWPCCAVTLVCSFCASKVTTEPTPVWTEGCTLSRPWRRRLSTPPCPYPISPGELATCCCCDSSCLQSVCAFLDRSRASETRADVPEQESPRARGHAKLLSFFTSGHSSQPSL